MKTIQPTMGNLATSRMGRVLIHAVCVLRHPANLRWHWDGILREIKHL